MTKAGVGHTITELKHAATINFNINTSNNTFHTATKPHVEGGVQRGMSQATQAPPTIACAPATTPPQGPFALQQPSPGGLLTAMPYCSKLLQVPLDVFQTHGLAALQKAAIATSKLQRWCSTSYRS